MAFQASHRFARIAPRKARLVADMIRGKRVDEALVALDFSKKRGSAFITELGISLDKLNWQNKEQNITITDLAEAVKREKQ